MALRHGAEIVNLKTKHVDVPGERFALVEGSLVHGISKLQCFQIVQVHTGDVGIPNISGGLTAPSASVGLGMDGPLWV